MSRSAFPRALRHSDVFVALDFETCDLSHQFPCAMAVVRVEHGQITQRVAYFIHQPASRFHQANMGIHGIEPQHVAHAAEFPQVWKSVAPLFNGAMFIAAHNAGFERAVLGKSLMRHELPLLNLPFVCTMKLAREIWELFPTGLAQVCEFLNLPLLHHDPLSDAEASAQIVLHALRTEPQTLAASIKAKEAEAVAAASGRRRTTSAEAAAAPFLRPI